MTPEREWDQVEDLLRSAVLAGMISQEQADESLREAHEITEVEDAGLASGDADDS